MEYILKPIKDNLTKGYYRLVLVMWLILTVSAPLLLKDILYTGSAETLMAFLLTPIIYYVLIRLVIWIKIGFEDSNES